jgi:hypothetical protein
MNKLKTISIFLCFAFLATYFSAFAQEDQSTDQTVQEMLETDEEITNEDLGVGSQNLLPGNPFYFLKEWRRGIQNFFTFNPVKKTELKLRFANEKMAEAKEMIRRERSEEDVMDALERAKKELE